MKKHPHAGSTLDDFLKDEGILETATAKAAKKVLAWQFAAAMARKRVSKAELARRMGTSRSQLQRLLNENVQSVTLGTITRAAQALELNPYIGLGEPPKKVA